MTGESPETLDLSALQSGCNDAWAAAYPVLWPVARGAARRGWHDASHEELDDIALHAIQLLAEEIHRLSHPTEVKPLLATIAYRRAISAQRHASVRPIPYSKLPAIANEAAPAAEAVTNEWVGAGPTSEQERADLTRLMERLLAKLPARDREWLLDRFVRGMSHQEIRTRRRQPLGTVCSGIQRALGKLRLQLSKKPELMKELRQLLR